MKVTLTLGRKQGLNDMLIRTHLFEKPVERAEYIFLKQACDENSLHQVPSFLFSS